MLAHAFLNSLLQTPNALANAGYNGRTPPLAAIGPGLLVHDGLIAANLTSTVVLQETIRRGLVELPLDEPTDGLWRRAWKEVSGIG